MQIAKNYIFFSTSFLDLDKHNLLCFGCTNLADKLQKKHNPFSVDGTSILRGRCQGKHMAEKLIHLRMLKKTKPKNNKKPPTSEASVQSSCLRTNQ